MIYFKAKEQDSLPKLTWELVANSFEELQYLGLENDPLVVSEDRLLNPTDPGYISYEYGICHVRVQDNALVPTLAADITAAQQAMEKADSVVKTRDTASKFKDRTFDFAGRKFPLNDGAIPVYQAIIDRQPPSKTIISLEGEYTLIQADIAAFKNAFYDTVIEIHEENVTKP